MLLMVLKKSSAKSWRGIKILSIVLLELEFLSAHGQGRFEPSCT